MSHTDRMRISPIQGCYFNCKYCDLNMLNYEKRSFKRIRESIEVALKDNNLKPRHLLISGGTPKPEDRKYLDEIYKKVTQFLLLKNIPVDIMLAPRPEKNYLPKYQLCSIMDGFLVIGCILMVIIGVIIPLGVVLLE